MRTACERPVMNILVVSMFAPLFLIPAFMITIIIDIINVKNQEDSAVQIIWGVSGVFPKKRQDGVVTVNGEDAVAAFTNTNNHSARAGGRRSACRGTSS